jgi:glycosyltransferase involved in cell wall biosynthesis
MALTDISAVIITRDAARTLATTLASLRDFPEVVVYDNGSTDETLTLARQFPNVSVRTGEFLGFGPTKNRAADLATRDWILSIDADEAASDELVASLRSVDLSDSSRTYMVHRHNLFIGRDIRWGGWGNDWLVRVYHRGSTRVGDALVHEKVLVPDGTAPVRIAGALWHDNVSDIDQLLQKISYYTELRRREGRGRVYPPAWTLLRAAWSFFRSYVLLLGMLAGWRGLVIAFSDSAGTFYKHMKRYSDEQARRE